MLVPKASAITIAILALVAISIVGLVACTTLPPEDASPLMVESPAGSGDFIPVDYGVVDTLTPTIKLNIGVAVDEIEFITLANSAGKEKTVDRQFTEGAATLDVEPGRNIITLKAGELEVSATMLNYDGTVMGIVPPLTEGITTLPDPDDATESFPHELLVIFETNADTGDISRMLREKRLRPVGLLQHSPEGGQVFILNIENNIDGLDVFALRDVLRGTRHVDVVTPHFGVPYNEILAESIPPRLLTGLAPNTDQGYNRRRAGFDNNDTACPNVAGLPPASGAGLISIPTCDEIDVFAHHFYSDTFAAHRLRHATISDGRSVLAVIDSGFGNDAQNTNSDVNHFFKFAHETSTPRGIDVGQAMVVRDTDPSFSNQATGNAALRVPQNGVSGIQKDGVEDLHRRVSDHGTRVSGHGTDVALDAVGNGRRKLGYGPSVSLLPVRINDPRTRPRSSPAARLVLGLQAASLIPEVDVINVSSGQTRIPGRPVDDPNFCARVRILAKGVRAAAASNKILVVGAGNKASDTSSSMLSLFAANRGRRRDVSVANPCFQGGRAPARMHRLIVPVGSTGILNDGEGPEVSSSFSNRGGEVSVSAAGGRRNIGVTPAGAFFPHAGTSLAAPKVAGLIAELVQVRDILAGGRRADAEHPNPSAQLRLIEIVEATADDLENDRTTLPAPDVLIESNTAGGISLPIRIPTNTAPHNQYRRHQGNARRPDDRFGYGRINAWKALLTVVNKGLAPEGRMDANGDGFDDTFAAVRHNTDDFRIKWYGFKIRTSVIGATVWIDGQKLQDAGAPTPFPDPRAPTPVSIPVRTDADIKAYQGIRNALAQTPGPPSSVIAMDRGTTAVGNDGGEYVITFSTTRPELVNNLNVPRTLVLRKRGAAVTDEPLYALRMDLTKMKRNRIAGVFYDDYVFEIDATDFGDTPDAGGLDGYKTTHGAGGGYHQNTNFEWLGPINPGTSPPKSIEHASLEMDAIDAGTSPDADGINNLLPNGGNDTDRFDDGVMFYPTTYTPGGAATTDFTVCVADPASERYSASPIYVNAWFDWDTDRKWEEVNNEHLIDGVEITPVFGFGAPLAVVWLVNHPRVALRATHADDHCATFRSIEPLPLGLEIGRGELRVRFRLDYGENAGRIRPIPDHLFALAGNHNLAKGPAAFGEVEDYILGSDFGDAQDPYMVVNVAGRYPSKGTVGARHLDFTREWFGDAGTRADVTRETDACDNTKSEEDGNANLQSRTCIGLDKDGKDAGTSIPARLQPNEQYDIVLKIAARANEFGFSNRGPGPAGGDSQGVNTLKPNCTMGPIANANDTPKHHRDRGRYGAWNERKRLYLRGWADWNGNGIWEAAELVVKGDLDPEDWGGNQVYTLGEPFTDNNSDGIWNPLEPFVDVMGKRWIQITCRRRAPANLPRQPYQWRFRLNYGEKNWTNDIKVIHHATEEPRALRQEKGGALWGEVEDHILVQGGRKEPPRIPPPKED